MQYNYFLTSGLVRYILTLIGLFILTFSSLADNSQIYLYEPSQTIKLDSIESILLENGLRIDNSFSDRKDTVAYFVKDDLNVLVFYSPKSEQIYKYWSYWVYNSSLKDNFSSTSRQSYGSSKQYFMNILDYEQQKYGEPSHVMINKNRMIKHITDKAQLDLLDYSELLSGDIYMKIYWEIADRVIMIGYDDSGRIEYEYTNLKSSALKEKELAIKDEEIASTEKAQSLTYYAIGAIVLVFLVLVLYALYKMKKRKAMQIAALKEEIAKEKEEEAARAMQIRQERLERVRQLELIHANYIKGLTEKYGECDKTIKLKPQNDIYNFEILLFSKSKHVVIGEKELSFSDILDCTFNDDIKETETEETFEENSYATTKTNTGSMIGRSIAGGVLLGGVGAIIGGSTAKKDTVIQHGGGTSITHREIEHNYTIAITVKDLSNPVLHLNVGSNISLKNEIVSLMKVIMSMQ